MEQPLGGMRGILPATTAGRSLRIVPAGSGMMLGILPSPSGRPPSGYALGMAAPRVEKMPNIIPASRGDTYRAGQGLSNVPRRHLLQRRLGQVLFVQRGPVLVRWRLVVRRLRRGYIFQGRQLDVYAMLERYLRSN